jgi:AbrB family looped-hinge helix DNA binding protein
MHNTYDRQGIDGGLWMSTVTISPKFKVVIPKPIRETIGLMPGDTMQIIQYGSRLELIPFKPLKTMKGFLKEIDTSFIREGFNTINVFGDYNAGAYKRDSKRLIVVAEV